MTADTASLHTDIVVRRWDADQTLYAAQRLGWQPDACDFDFLGIKPYLVTTHEDSNLVTTSGWVALLGGIAGTTITNKFDASHGRIGVGTVSTAATAADVKLGGDSGGGSTTSYYKLVSGAPTINTGVVPSTLTFQATFGTAVANFAWAEFGIDNFTADGVTTQATGAVFFNHGISSQGTKASGQTWAMTVTVNGGFAASVT